MVVPVFNERESVRELISRVRAVEIPKEIILVDDFSSDGTRDILQSLADIEDVRVFFHDRNRGKGAAVHTGLSKATGDFVVIQDADLEYDPQDFHKLLRPILENKADVVFGSRFIGGDSHRVLYFWHYVGNRTLTLLSNMLTNLNLTDMEVCYRVFRREIIQSLPLYEERFVFEPEVTAKVARLGCRIYEVGINYHGRTYAEGKKIGWKDGVRALWCIVKYNTWARLRLQSIQGAQLTPPSQPTA